MRKTILLSLLMAVGLALFAGCTTLTGKTAGENIDDASITTQANAIIIKDQDARFLKIDVNTTNGNVSLTGFIHDKAAEGRIVAKIRQINGVKSVESNLKIEEKK